MCCYEGDRMREMKEITVKTEEIIKRCLPGLGHIHHYRCATGGLLTLEWTLGNLVILFFFRARRREDKMEVKNGRGGGRHIHTSFAESAERALREQSKVAAGCRGGKGRRRGKALRGDRAGGR